MKNKLFGFLMMLLLTMVPAKVSAQQPQAQQGQPIYSVNAKYTNGVAPGYWPTSNISGLDVTISPGTSNCGGGDVFYTGGFLSMSPNAINYIDLSASDCTPEVSTVGYQSNMHIAQVYAGLYTITSVNDTRTLFFRGGGPSGGGQNYFNAKLYGSVCDGVTRVPDDGPGITAAATAASVAGPMSIVLLPAGANCIVNSHPTFGESGLTIEAYGAEITSTNTDYILQFTGKNQAVRGLTFIDDQPTVTNENVIQLVAVNGFLIEDSGIISNAPIASHMSGIGLVYTNRVSLTQDQMITDYLADPSMNTDGNGGASPFSRDVRVLNCKCIEKQAVPTTVGVVSVLQTGVTSTLTLISGAPFNTAWTGGIAVGGVSYPIASIPNTTTLTINSGPATVSAVDYSYSLIGTDQCIQFAFTKGGVASGNYIFGYGSGVQYWGGSNSTVSGTATTTSGGLLDVISLNAGSASFDTTPGSTTVGGTIQIAQVPPSVVNFTTLYRIMSVNSPTEVVISPVLPCPVTMSCPQNLSSVSFSGSLDNVTSPRLAQDIVVNNNICEGCTIWGAYGQGVLFNSNRADGGFDVGFDMEGTIDSQVVGNSCSNMPNGCLTVFASCQGLLYSGNVVKQANSLFPLAPIYGDLVNCSNVDVVNNEFDGLDPIAFSPLVRSYGSANVRNFSYNKFNNAYANVFFESPVVNIIGNQFDYTFTSPTAFNAILAFREDEFWPPAAIPSLFNIRDNTVTSFAVQPAGSQAIGCAFADSVHTGTGTCILDANVLQGPNPFPIDISIGDGSGANNPSPPNGNFINPAFIVTNNKLRSPEILVNFQGGFLAPPIMTFAGNIDTNTGYIFNSITTGPGSITPPSTIVPGPDLFQVNPDPSLENPVNAVNNPAFTACSGATCSDWSNDSSWSFSASGATWDGTSAGLLKQTAANAVVPILDGAYYDVSVNITGITGTPTLLLHGEFTPWNSGSGVAFKTALGIQHLYVQALGQQPYIALYAMNSGTIIIAEVDCHLLGGSGTFQNNIQVDNVPVYASISDAEADGMTPGQFFQESSGELFVIPSFIVTGPAAPTGLTATAGSLSVALAWTASAGCPSCTYNVYDSTVSGGPYSLVANSVKAVTYDVTGLVAGTEYYFVVQGQNHAGVGPASAQANATPTP